MTRSTLLQPRLPLFRFLSRDPQANKLFTLGLGLFAVAIAYYFLSDRSTPHDEGTSFVASAVVAWIALLIAALACLRWRRQANLGRIGKRTTARVSEVFIFNGKYGTSYVLLDYVYKGQPLRSKYPTMRDPGLELGDTLDLFVDPERPQRVVPVSLFVLDREAQRE